MPQNLPSTRFLYQRPVDSNKYDYGHALLVAGSYGKMGCAVLAARACLRSGAGLLTVHLPEQGLAVMQTALPEAMCSIDPDGRHFAHLPAHLDRYHAVAVGPGIGTERPTAEALLQLWDAVSVPLLLDADALNILAKVRQGVYAGLSHRWRREGQPRVVTPHAAEYQRLFGDADPASVAQTCHLVVVKKGHATTVYAPDGRQYVNDNGNPGMATAGSGDVLTGILLGLLAQGVAPYDAAVLAVRLHGAAGDRVLRRRAQASLIASDIVEALLPAED